MGLMMPCERKSVKPMAAITAPERTGAHHQSLLPFGGEGRWSDEKVLAKVREMVLPQIERHGPTQACWSALARIKALILAMQGGFHEQLPDDRLPDGLSAAAVGDEWLPQRHLARFVVAGPARDERELWGAGSASYHPRLLLGLLVNGYATGVVSSRKLDV